MTFGGSVSSLEAHLVWEDKVLASGALHAHWVRVEHLALPEGRGRALDLPTDSETVRGAPEGELLHARGTRGGSGGLSDCGTRAGGGCFTWAGGGG